MIPMAYGMPAKRLVSFGEMKVSVYPFFSLIEAPSEAAPAGAPSERWIEPWRLQRPLGRRRQAGEQRIENGAASP